MYNVVCVFVCSCLNGGMFYIEDIQDQVEFVLMCGGEYNVVCVYVLYCEKCYFECQYVGEEVVVVGGELIIGINVVDNGVMCLFDLNVLCVLIVLVCDGFGVVVNFDLIVVEMVKNLYDGVLMSQVYDLVIFVVCMMIEKDLVYSQVMVCILLYMICCEIFGEEVVQVEMLICYVEYFLQFLKCGVDVGLFDDKLLQFDLKCFGEVFDVNCDLQFGYFGLQMLYDCYFLYVDGICIEMLQVFFMCVVMGLLLNEIDCEMCVIEFYNVLLSFDFMSLMLMLFNLGMYCLQLLLCYLMMVVDDFDGIYEVLKENVLLLKFVGGFGNDWMCVCVFGLYIKGMNGKL